MTTMSTISSIAQPAVGLGERFHRATTKLISFPAERLPPDGDVLELDLLSDNALFASVMAWRYDGTMQLSGSRWFHVAVLEQRAAVKSVPDTLYRHAGKDWMVAYDFDPERFRSPVPIESEYGWWREEHLGLISAQAPVALRISRSPLVPRDVCFNLWVKYDLLYSMRSGSEP